MAWNDNFKRYNTSTGFGNSKDWKKNFRSRITGEEAAEILRDQPGTPHEILGISIHATQSEIRKAYMVLIKKWHPDNNPDKVEQATEMAKKIIAAYTTLKK